MKSMFDDAKKTHNSIEVPPELDFIIKNAINKEDRPTVVQKALVYRYASVAVCFLICAIIGIGYFAMSKNAGEAIPADSGIEVYSSERMVAAPSITNDSADAETESLKMNAQNGATEESVITELYSDDDILSYSVSDFSSDELVYHNISRVDGAEITLESLVDDLEFNSENSVFYFKARDEIVVICDGVENIVKLK